MDVSPVSVGRLAMTLHLLLREHRLALPDDAELLEELATVRLRESTPGVYRLDHDASGHDDRAVAIGLAALALTERAEGRGSITIPRSASPVVRTLTDARPGLPSRLAVRAAARTMPRGLPGGAVLLHGSANDPRSVAQASFLRSRRTALATSQRRSGPPSLAVPDWLVAARDSWAVSGAALELASVAPVGAGSVPKHQAARSQPSALRAQDDTVPVRVLASR